jgi:hypothetical protein
VYTNLWTAVEKETLVSPLLKPESFVQSDQLF